MSTVNHVVLALARAGQGGVDLLGTCFVIGSKYVATALHVVGADDKDLKVIRPKVKSIEEYQDSSDREVSVHSASIVAVDSFRDLCILEVRDALFSITYRLSGSDETPPGSSVYLLGYPHANHGRMIFTIQPTTVGARVLIPRGDIKSKGLVINTQTRPGQSGSPVFNSETGDVCAMVLGSYAPGVARIVMAGIDPATLHQTSHAISVEYLKGMIP